MRCLKPLYAGESAAARKTEILRALRRGKPVLGVYVITRALDSDGILDIYHSVVFLSDSCRKKDPLVLGIACGKREAMEVARRIVDDLYHRNGDFDIDSFCDSQHT